MVWLKGCPIVCLHRPQACNPSSEAMSGSGMFTRFVQPGRLSLITYGPYTGKMCTIIEIVDQRRVIVDGPEDVTGVHRHVLPVRWLSLTDIRMKIGRSAKVNTLKKALERNKVMEKWAETKEAKKMAAKEFRKNMNDFDRFKLKAAKSKRAKLVRKAIAKK